MKTFRFTAIACALAGAMSVAGTASADGPMAVATAAQHAGIAAGQGNIGGVRTHLHHVLNCLVGPDGEGFDQSAGNPCANAGGAIPQTSDAAMKRKLEMIAGEVREGVMGQDLDAAKQLAASVQEQLSD